MLERLKQQKSNLDNLVLNYFTRSRGNDLTKETQDRWDESVEQVKINKKKIWSNMGFLALIGSSVGFFLSVFLNLVLPMPFNIYTVIFSSTFSLWYIPLIFANDIVMLTKKPISFEELYRFHYQEELVKYQNAIVLGKDDLKPFYETLCSYYAGRDENYLSIKMKELMGPNEQIGSYTLLAKMYNEAIRDQEEKMLNAANSISEKELKDQVASIIA